LFFLNDTVDGRSPAPVDLVNIPLFTWFYTSQVVAGHFFHQQYDNESTNFQVSTVIVGGLACGSMGETRVFRVGTWASKANNGKSFKAIIPRNEKNCRAKL